MRGFQDSGTKDSTPLNSNRRQRRRTQTPAHHPRRRLQIGCLGFFSSNFTRFVIVKSQRFLESKPVMLGETPNPSPKSTSDKPTPSPETRLAAPFVQPLVISKSELQSFFRQNIFLQPFVISFLLRCSHYRPSCFSAAGSGNAN